MILGQAVTTGVATLLTLSALGQIPTSGISDNSTAIARFQVATIKPSSPDESRTMRIRGNRFATSDTSLVDLLKYAYGLQEREIIGGPTWLTTQKFDVVGDPEVEIRPSSADFKKMLQDLLTDRFHLLAHRETRDLAVFEIVPAKNGPKLEKSTRPADGIPTVAYVPGQLSAANASVADLATFMQRFVADRPVIDRSGIIGRFDLSLRWEPDEFNADGSHPVGAHDNSLPGLFAAIQEQLGLKLREAKRPTSVFVVDHVDMPSED